MRKLLILLAICAQTAMAQQDIVVALKPDKNPEAMLDERKKLQEFLQIALKKKIKVIVPLSGAVIQEGLVNGTIDLAFVSALEVVKLESLKAGEILLATEIGGKSHYESYWLTLKDKPFQSVADLKGKPIAFASRTSTSGYLVPVADLVRKNLLGKKQDPETFFGKGNITFGTGYVSAIERVLSGQAEAAAVSDYVFNGDKHLTNDQKSKLRILAAQGPVPTHIFAVRKKLNPEIKAALAKTLLSLNDQSELRDRLFTGKIVQATSENHLKGFRDSLDITGIRID